MTNKDKQLLARALIIQAANLLDVYQESSGYWSDIEHINRDEAANQLAQWLKYLPGDGWDSRLPNPYK